MHTKQYPYVEMCPKTEPLSEGQGGVGGVGQTAYPGVGGHEGVWASWGPPVGGEGVRLGDERVVALVIHSRVDKSAVHAPGAITCKKSKTLKTKTKKTGANFLRA